MTLETVQTGRGDGCLGDSVPRVDDSVTEEVLPGVRGGVVLL